MRFFLILTLITTSCLADVGDTLIYYDFISDETFILGISGNKSTVSAFHYKNKMEACNKEDKSICFNSKYFSFSIPKKLNDLKEWSSGETKYCLKRRFYNRESRSRSLVVNFGYESTCKEIEKTGYKIVFDTKFGLTYMEGRNFNGFPVKLVLIGKYGFGGKSKVKTN